MISRRTLNLFHGTTTQGNEGHRGSLNFLLVCRERSGSVVECLTQDRGVGGSSLTGVTVLWSLSKTHLSYLSTGSTQEEPPLLN